MPKPILKAADRLFRSQKRDLLAELRRSLEAFPAGPTAGEEKAFPSAADILSEHAARPDVPSCTPRDERVSPGAADRREIAYSIPLPPETEKWLRDEEELREKTFSSRLIRLLEERGVRPSAFYRAAGMDRKLFSAIRCDAYYQPSRDTAIRCCLALRLGADEAAELLASAGYALSDAKRSDLIVRACIERGVFGVNDVNDILYALNEKTLR